MELSPGSWVVPRLWGNSRAPSLAAEYVLTWMMPMQMLPERTAGSPEPSAGSGCEQGLAERSREHSKRLGSGFPSFDGSGSHILPLSEREKAMRWTEWTKWPRRNQKKKKTRIVSSKRASRWVLSCVSYFAIVSVLCPHSERKFKEVNETLRIPRSTAAV